MEIKLKNLDGDGVLVVKGPQVPVILNDAGGANVTVNFSISDGTHFHFPDGGPLKTEKTTVLPKGDFNCVVLVAAFNHGTFGSTYDSSVTIAGKVVATAKGTVSKADEFDSDIQAFVLKVS